MFRKVRFYHKADNRDAWTVRQTNLLQTTHE